MGGQTLNDRILAARHSLAGQGLAKAVCNATTEELIGPKKKHLDCKYDVILYLLFFGRPTFNLQTIIARKFDAKLQIILDLFSQQENIRMDLNSNNVS